MAQILNTINTLFCLLLKQLYTRHTLTRIPTLSILNLSVIWTYLNRLDSPVFVLAVWSVIYLKGDKPSAVDLATQTTSCSSLSLLTWTLYLINTPVYMPADVGPEQCKETTAAFTFPESSRGSSGTGPSPTIIVIYTKLNNMNQCDEGPYPVWITPSHFYPLNLRSGAAQEQRSGLITSTTVCSAVMVTLVQSVALVLVMWQWKVYFCSK